MFKALPLELVEAAKSLTRRTTRPSTSNKILKHTASLGLSGIVEMRIYSGKLRMLSSNLLMIMKPNAKITVI